MDIVKEERQRNEFRDLLFSLADSQKILQSSSERVEIYTLMDAVHPPRKGQALRCAFGNKNRNQEEKRWNSKNCTVQERTA